MNPRSLFRRRTLIALGCALLGLLADFLCNGVAKIGTAWVYVPVVLVAATSLAAYLRQTRWQELAGLASLSLVAGAALGHLLFAGRLVVRSYELKLLQPSPLTLGSPLWPQRLVVEGAAIQKDLLAKTQPEGIMLVLEELTDYGCIRSEAVRSVDGVDMKSDSSESWAWQKSDLYTGASGPGSEDQALPWCRYSPF